MRICSFLPSATEIAFALGLGDCVVGVTHECDYPPEAQTKLVVVNSLIDPNEINSKEIDQAVREYTRARTSPYRIDSARLQHARPDLILTQALCDVCALDHNEVVAASQSLEPTPQIISLNPHSLTDIFFDIRLVGSVTGKMAEADSLVARLQERVAAIERKTLSARRPRVACVEWLDPLFSAGHWVPEMVTLAGGHNRLAEKGETSRRIEWSEVLEFSPEVLVLMPCGFDVARTLREAEGLSRAPRWSELPAVRNRRVFAVNAAAYFSRSGPRLIDGLEILARIVHPEIFSEPFAPEAAQRVC
jgi:iron complex transport system substrate-binding protein